jgi:hypothetical protein
MNSQLESWILSYRFKEFHETEESWNKEFRKFKEDFKQAAIELGDNDSNGLCNTQDK